MNFRNIETGGEFQYFNPRYCSYETDKVTYAKGFKGHKYGYIHYFNYTSPDTFNYIKGENDDSPVVYISSFLFMDVDFDGKDEFITSDYYTGEVGINYEVYDITDNGLVRTDTISWNGIRQRIDN